jgi:hypothetical protein
MGVEPEFRESVEWDFPLVQELLFLLVLTHYLDLIY